MPTQRPVFSLVPAPGFPGQANNPVGFAAAPGFNTLTAWPGGTGAQSVNAGTNAQSGSGTTIDPWVFNFYDFNALTFGTDIALNNCKFIGCRFQSNHIGDTSVKIIGANNVTFSYCSFTPLASLYTSPPGLIWPSASAGQNTITQVTDVNCINGNSGYQHGAQVFNSTDGPVTWDHCDFWGFGNDAITFATGGAPQMMVKDCWIHDACNTSPQTYHTDGLGYLDAGAAPANITIDHCTVASLGATNGIAFQTTTTSYANIIVKNCFFSGFDITVDMCHDIAGSTGLVFTDNIFGTDISWKRTPDGSVNSLWASPTNVWRRNKLRVLAGTNDSAGSGEFLWTAVDDGKYLLPDDTLSTTDYTG